MAEKMVKIITCDICRKEWRIEPGANLDGVPRAINMYTGVIGCGLNIEIKDVCEECGISNISERETGGRCNGIVFDSRHKSNAVVIEFIDSDTRVVNIKCKDQEAMHQLESTARGVLMLIRDGRL